MTMLSSAQHSKEVTPAHQISNNDNGQRQITTHEEMIAATRTGEIYLFQCWRCQQTAPNVTFPKNPDNSLRQKLCNHCYGNMSGNISLHNKNARKWGVDGHITRNDWLQILFASEGYCHYCKQHIGYARLVLEHVTPMVAGGSNDPENIVAACVSCNSKKAKSSVAEWRQRTENKELLALLQQHFATTPNEVINRALKALAAHEGIFLTKIEGREAS